MTFTAVEGAVNFIKGSKKLAGDLDKHTDRVLGEAIREHKEKETDPAKLQQLDAAEKLLHGGKAAPKAQQAVAASQPTPEPAAPADNTPPATSHADKIVAERQAAQGKAASVA